MFIYALSDPRTGELRYVGKTTRSLESRLRAHVKDCHRYINHCAHWVLGLRKRGLKPVAEVVEACATLEDLDDAERFWIEQLRALGFRLTNLADGGGGTVGVRPSDAQRVKISTQLGGRSIQDHLGRIYLTKREAEVKLGVARQQITKVLRGREKQACGYSFSYVGQPVPLAPVWTAEDSLRHSRQRGGRPIVDQDGVIYQTVKEAADKLRLNCPHISSVLNGYRRSVGGYVFRYADLGTQSLAQETT